MNILSVAYPLFPVGPDSAGGAEQILYLLERGLFAAEHCSVTIAAAGSRVSGTLIETCVPEGEITREVQESVQRVHCRRIQEALERYPIDLIHFHGLDFDRYLPEAAVPMLATLHLPPAWYSPGVFEQSRVALNCVSESQASSISSARKPRVIWNGIDTGCYGLGARNRDALLILGRICPEKGVDVALRVAHRLDLPLVVAGPVHPLAYHERYFRESVEPLLDRKRRYTGAIALAEKIELLRAARCVLIPSLAPETSSLVAMEAMASGTPVVAFRSGALPEIVEHGKTGFLVDSEDEMAEAATQVGNISPETCRAHARDRFDAQRMIGDYVDFYEELVTRTASAFDG